MDDGLKQRLVGAIVLVAIAVIFLPTLLDREARRTVDLTSQIPPEPTIVAQVVEVAEPVPPEDIPAAKALAENYPHEAVEPQPATDDLASEGPAVEPSASAVRPDAPPLSDSIEAPTLNAEGVPDGWSLQVASFQSADRAEAMREKLLAEGFKGYIRSAKTSQGTVHRVFVGPKINRAAAEAEKRSIDQRFKTDALVVEFKP
ncbi:SPOR domain-containing protein [Proteobacteria bacterium 005FR1]|nr:SPOR domain-containing protein [Proteobacteria bacterium 005FR1]